MFIYESFSLSLRKANRIFHHVTLALGKLGKGRRWKAIVTATLNDISKGVKDKGKGVP